MDFRIIFAVLGVIAVLAAVYFVTRFHRFYVVRRISKNNRFLGWVVAFLPVLLIGIATYLTVFTMIVVILHLLTIWIIADFIGWIIKKATHQEWKFYYQGMIAILFTLVYLMGGYYVAHHVVQTNYQVSITGIKETEMQQNAGTRIAMIADSHLGTTFDGEGFAEELKKIQKQNPDMLVIVGDFVDDDTKKKDMIVACQALSNFQSKYGVFYVFGNHDKGYFQYRDFNTQELVNELEKNHVVILEDEIYPLDENMVLVGRQDKSNRQRAEISSLIGQVEADNFSIVLDHQPSDYSNEAAAGVDLVLSGHTHGGWLFPMNIISQWIGPDDWIYGTTTKENTQFIVTSGISDWALPFKTGTKAEFVIIDIQ